MSLSYKGENIPEMYDEIQRLRGKLERARELTDYLQCYCFEGTEAGLCEKCSIMRELETGGGDESTGGEEW